MQFLNKLDTPLHRILGKARPVPGDVGVEIELEGKLTFPQDSFWTYKEEGSLRGGGEYVLAKPVSMNILPDALEILQKTLDSGKPKNSIRCSTHVHVNVSDLTTRQIWQFLLAYYLLEPLLMRTQPKKRWGNLFSLTMEYAESIYLDLMYDIRSEKPPFGTFNRDRNRYAALNLVAIHKFQSVEFRFLDAMTDTKLVHAWCKMFRQLVTRGSQISPLQLLKMYDELTPQEFVSHFLGEGSEMVFTHVARRAQDLNGLIHMNYDYVFEMAHTVVNQKFEMPRSHWVDDLAEVREEVAHTGNPFDWGDAVTAAGNQLNTPAEPIGLDEALAATNPTPQPWQGVHFQTTAWNTHGSVAVAANTIEGDLETDPDANI